MYRDLDKRRKALLKASRRWLKKPGNRAKSRAKGREWYRKNKIKFLSRLRTKRRASKLEALTHYGKGGKLLCSGYGCRVHDLDLLTLDHVNDDGAKKRRQEESCHYSRLKNEGWPPGFQTLCWNHQWKKEMNRRRKNN